MSEIDLVLDLLGSSVFEVRDSFSWWKVDVDGGMGNLGIWTFSCSGFGAIGGA